ncbi:unnamed protein product, partial [Angiostrongylus costaricensis]|uniref:Meiosis-specific nuclear structural protein 1 n=1 Tax=Angiostrongylus costaricensis TaxID=334426 RepID=A0A0R3Q2T3_ANGCS
TFVICRIEAEEAERNRCEEEKIVREREAQIRRKEEEQRRHLEAEYLREQERVRKVLEEALERAKHEAEITRKAKVYKHVLEAADKTPELERRLLGVDPETGDRILQEVQFVLSARSQSRQTISEAEMMSVAGNDGGKTSPRRKQIASAHQFVLADDHPIRRANEFSGYQKASCFVEN